MHTNYAWLGFLAAATLLVLAYGLSTGRELQEYYSLKGTATAQVTEWSIDSTSGDKFLVKATYVFTANDQEIQGEYLFTDYPSRNRWQAEKRIQNWEQQTWTAHFKPATPSFSRLERPFPYKTVISTLVLVAIYLYFIGLGYYVRRMGNRK